MSKKHYVVWKGAKTGVFASWPEVKALTQGRADAQFMGFPSKEEAEAVVANADQYADALLAKLQLTVTKMQQNLIRLERNLQDGRQLVSDQSQGHRKDKDETESTPSE